MNKEHDINTFVENLKTIPLEKSEYKKNDLDDHFINSIIDSYNLIKLNNIDASNEIIEFIINYNPVNLEIGMIRFLSYDDILENDTYHIFGSFDADSLAINKSNGRIVVLDANSNVDTILWDVAKDSHSFMEALIISGKYLERAAFDEKFDSHHIISKTAKLCSEKVGGENFLNFYLVLLGSEE